MILGELLLGTPSRSRWRSRHQRPGLAATLLAILGWFSLLTGLFLSLAIMASILAPVIVIVAAVIVFVFVSVRYHYQKMEKRSLLWLLMVAAERGIPLEEAARDFAEERRDWIGSRALDLAEYLEAGLPLALAAQRSGLPLPPGVLLAANIGQQAGNLGPALRQAMSRDNASEAVLRSALDDLFYVLLVIVLGLCIWAFMMIKIVPVFYKILADFETPMPIATQWMVSAGQFLFGYWPLILLAVAALVSLLLRVAFYYAGMSTQLSLGPGRLEQTSDGAVVMRWLAVAVRRNRPVVEMLRLLAGYFPRRSMRRKLGWTARRIDQGAGWSETLARVGLIRRREAAVFNAAQRTGNLAWALEEMAERTVRRVAYRLRAATGILFPAALLFLGICVVLVALGCLTPLVVLIQSLA